jgi:hypothetical protein
VFFPLRFRLEITIEDMSRDDSVYSTVTRRGQDFEEILVPSRGCCLLKDQELT